MATVKLTLREKCPYSEFFRSVFSRIRTEYGEILHMSPYSIRMWKNTDQKKPEYGHFSRSVRVQLKSLLNILEAASWIDRLEFSNFNGQSIGGKMKIRLEKPALNNFKTYGWQK